MDLSLSEAQKMLKSTARTFFRQECPWTTIKQIDESPTGFSPELWGKVAQMGWLGMNFHENYGGMGCTLTDLAIIYEEMGQALVPGVFFSSPVLCGSIINRLGTENQKQRILPAIASGEEIVALAFTEPDYGWGAENVSLTAKRSGDKYVLDGKKCFVHDAQIASKIMVVTRAQDPISGEDGCLVAIVDGDVPGISCRPLTAFSGERLSELSFNSVEAPSQNIIGEKVHPWVDLYSTLNNATAILCAYMVGGCQRLLDMTVQYARTREQFGQPIGSFQWVQGYIIEQANQLERCRWLAWEALWKLDAGKSPQEQIEAVSLAKAAASDAFLECGHLAHEVHAGLGVDKKYPLYLYSKKSKTLYSYLGDPYFHRKRIALTMDL